jgi:glycosyltransferase involved in cell wall biosynthesis
MASTYPRWADDHEPGFVHELTRRLTSRFDVIVIAPHASGSADLEEMDGIRICRFRYAPIRLETLVNDGGIVTNLRRKPWKWLLLPFFFVGLLFSTARAIRSFRPDVVHAHWLIPQGLVLFFLRLIGFPVPPYLVTSHGADLFALRARPLVWLKRRIALQAKAVTVVSEAMRDELVRIGVPEERIEVRSMGVDLADRFSPVDIARTGYCLRQVLFVGRMVEKKGARYLVEAIPELANEFPDVLVKFIGNGPELQELKALAEKLGVLDRIEFVGAQPQEHVAKAIRESLVFVAPFVEAKGGDQEGLGLVLVEALGSGCPAVVTDIAAARDVTGISGGVQVVPQRSPAALAECIARVLRCPEVFRSDAIQSRQKLVEKFDWSSVAEGYELILLRVAGNVPHV